MASMKMSSGGQPLHVLAVDDSSVDRKVIERVLMKSSLKVTVVDSGKKALELLGLVQTSRSSGSRDGTSSSSSKVLEVDMIITDYWMPEVTGYDLLRRVKGSSSLKEIPVVILSSENVPNTINRCMEEGAEDFLLKPLSSKDVARLGAHINNLQRRKYGN